MRKVGFKMFVNLYYNLASTKPGNYLIAAVQISRENKLYVLPRQNHYVVFTDKTPKLKKRTHQISYDHPSK